MSKQTYKYRLYPTHKQVEQLAWVLARCRELYNAALQERRDAYQMAGKSLNYYDQANQLPAVKEARPEYLAIHSQVQQDVLRRVDKAFAAFFRRVKAGQTPGYPRFQGRDRYDSFTYPQLGWSLDGDRLTLSKLGTVKVKLHRPIGGLVKTVTIRRDGEQWYVCFSCAIAVALLPEIATATGVDLGLTHFATLADGSTIENPRPLRHSLRKLKAAQQQLSRCRRGSHRRSRARHVVARLHRKVGNQRADFGHKAARALVNRYGTIVFEDLSVKNMVKLHSLALSISDAGWGQFVQFCSDKAARAGRNVLFVDPRYTSQTCSNCGTIQKKALSERWHSCPCGCELDRDHNAAINILRLGSSQQAVSVCRSPALMKINKLIRVWYTRAGGTPYGPTHPTHPVRRAAG
jgi:putative transposase